MNGSITLTHQVDALRFERLRGLIGARGMTGDEAVRLARETLRGFVATPAGRRCESWAEAWNLMTGATPTRPGVLTAREPRCRTCRGSGV